MTRFLEIKPIPFINPKLKQKEEAEELRYSSPIFQHYRNDIKMQSLYKSNDPKKPLKSSNDFRRPQTTLKELITHKRKIKWL